ncbi:MAG: IPExxxVDY family protein [Flavitalea sp.]
MKLKLDMDDMADEFLEDTRIIGIVAPVKDYQLCWKLNQLLRFDFRNNNDIEIQLKRKNRTYYFSVFEYPQPNTALVHYLYNNGYDGEFLLPEFKHLDYLWLMKGDTVKEEFVNDLMSSLRTINGVQLVTEIRHDKIRHKAHLIF